MPNLKKKHKIESILMRSNNSMKRELKIKKKLFPKKKEKFCKWRL